ncbi:MerR family transcriptional regulator, partial [Streptomyces sp. NPDC052693]
PDRGRASPRRPAMPPAPARAGPPPPRAGHRGGGARGAALLYAGLAEAFALAAAPVRRAQDPRPGEALDAYVAAYASAYGSRDTRGFRRLLADRLAAEARLDRYWELAAVVLSEPGGPAQPTPGSADDWLRAALRQDNAAAA